MYASCGRLQKYTPVTVDPLGDTVVHQVLVYLDPELGLLKLVQYPVRRVYTLYKENMYRVG